eukprot:COSAG05_NODE_61_length_23137_cov_22.080693_2_plen_80_part_00
MTLVTAASTTMTAPRRLLFSPPVMGFAPANAIAARGCLAACMNLFRVAIPDVELYGRLLVNCMKLVNLSHAVDLIGGIF